jgi:AraC-like DNA-binding protein
MAAAKARDIGLDRAMFASLCRSYGRRWGVGLCAVTPEGEVVHAWGAARWSGPRQRDSRRLAVHEALRWGEPAVEPAPGEIVLWGVPLMHNAVVLGGLVAGIAEKRLFGRGNRSRLDVRAACSDLRRAAEQLNLTNAALLESKRQEYQREQSRAEAIHAFKATPMQDIRGLYLLEEPALVTAVRKGDRAQAREILNRLLVAMIHRGAGRIDLVKSFFMELVAMMTRTAVEVGGSPQELLGTNYNSIAKLSALRDDEQLAPWLHEMLERIMDAIRAGRQQPRDLMLSHVLRLAGERCCDGFGRDEAAAAAGLSPAHFSRLFRRQYGRSFSAVLQQMRADHAADMLARTDKPVKIIAVQCGFADQSHLTKAFRRLYRCTPAKYRREHQSTKD